MKFSAASAMTALILILGSEFPAPATAEDQALGKWVGILKGGAAGQGTPMVLNILSVDNGNVKFEYHRNMLARARGVNAMFPFDYKGEEKLTPAKEGGWEFSFQTELAIVHSFRWEPATGTIDASRYADNDRENVADAKLHKEQVPTSEASGPTDIPRK